jgi:ribokinase
VSEDLDLLVVCELNPDILVTDPALDVRFGQVEQYVADAGITLGSSGAITAAAAAAQGARVAVVALVGADLAGDVARRALGELGVDTTAVLVRPGARTGMTVVLSTADGDRALLTFPGTMSGLTVQDVPADMLRRARHVHISSFYLQSGLHPGLAGLLRTARARGATTSLDPGWDPHERWSGLVPVLADLDLLLPNAAECTRIAAAITGRATGADAGAEQVAAAAEVLAALGPRVVVKLGAEGGLAVGDGRPVHVPAPAADIVDTTGAGDNFDAGFLVATLYGEDARTALERAVAAGSLSLRGRGGTGRLASAEEVADVAARLRAAPVAAARSLPAQEPA